MRESPPRRVAVFAGLALVCLSFTSLLFWRTLSSPAPVAPMVAAVSLTLASIARLLAEACGGGEGRAASLSSPSASSGESGAREPASLFALVRRLERREARARAAGGGAPASGPAAAARARIARLLLSGDEGALAYDALTLLDADSPSAIVAQRLRGVTPEELALLPTHRFCAPAPSTAARSRSATQWGGSSGSEGANALALAAGIAASLGAGVHARPQRTPAHPPPPSCAICLEAFAEGDALRTLPCVHAFHARCADRWLAATPLCPLCRAGVRGAGE